jgi:5-methylcytosine-specific restriction endonuclease McrA
MDTRQPARDLFWRDRDGSTHRCPKCGRPRDLVDAIEVHHADRNKRRHAASNLLGLCRACHQADEHDNRRRLPSRLQPRHPRGAEPPTSTASPPGK